MQLKIKKLHPDAQLPTYGSAGAACFDLRTIHGDLIEPGQAATFRTGLAVEVPEGWRLDVHSRSGDGFNRGLRLANATGKIDADYRGEVLVRLHNDSDIPAIIHAGDRIAQGELERVRRVEFVEADELTETMRGEGGLGSTGAA